MIIVQVEVRVKPEFTDAFEAATKENASHSIKEPGIARFDFLQDIADSARYVLTEVYRAADSQAKHRETAHYLKWRETVEPMMAAPRIPSKYTNLFPADEGW